MLFDIGIIGCSLAMTVTKNFQINFCSAVNLDLFISIMTLIVMFPLLVGNVGISLYLKIL